MLTKDWKNFSFYLKMKFKKKYVFLLFLFFFSLFLGGIYNKRGILINGGNRKSKRYVFIVNVQKQIKYKQAKPKYEL